RTAAGLCGIEVDALVTAAEWFGRSRSVLSLHGGGLVRPAHGADALRALFHLHLATGQLGQPGAAGLHPLATGPRAGTVAATAHGQGGMHRFQVLVHRAPAEAVSARFPLRLLTCRLDVAQAMGAPATDQAGAP